MRYERKIKNLEHLKCSWNILLFIKQCYHIAWSVEKIQKVKSQKLEKGRTTFLSKYAVCDRKKSRSIKEEETSGLLSSLRI